MFIHICEYRTSTSAYIYHFFIFQKESPSSGKFTALGVYLLTSLFFVVAGFIEFAFVLHLHHINEQQLQKQKATSKCKGCSNDKAASDHIVNNFVSNNKPGLVTNVMFDIKKIDIIAFVIGLVLYFLFNVVYWTVFLNFSFD